MTVRRRPLLLSGGLGARPVLRTGRRALFRRARLRPARLHEARFAVFALRVTIPGACSRVQATRPVHDRRRGSGRSAPIANGSLQFLGLAHRGSALTRHRRAPAHRSNRSARRRFASGSPHARLRPDARLLPRQELYAPHPTTRHSTNGIAHPAPHGSALSRLRRSRSLPASRPSRLWPGAPHPRRMPAASPHGQRSTRRPRLAVLRTASPCRARRFAPSLPPALPYDAKKRRPFHQ